MAWQEKPREKLIPSTTTIPSGLRARVVGRMGLIAGAAGWMVAVGCLVVHVTGWA